jgi:CheY-like chemotaxis protein
MLTAFGREEALRQVAAQRVTVSGVLTKPVTPSTLLEACTTALGMEPRKVTRNALRAETRHSHTAQLAGAHILLVEDNAINQELAVDLLSGVGVTVTVASDGRQALDLLLRQPFDGVLMDCQMPVMDGYEATRLLRRQPHLRELPVIAMTANAMVGDREKVLAAGMDDHIAKPISVEEMFATLARWIRPAGAAAPAAVAVPGALQAHSPGIDADIGRANAAGNDKLYRRLLGMYRDEQHDFVARFRAARIAGDTLAVIRMAHDLKSVSGTIGASDVQRAAAALEAACIENDEGAVIDVLLETVNQALSSVIAGLRAPEA